MTTVQRLMVLAVFVATCAAALWTLRYETLAPVAHRVTMAGESVILCVRDRWLNSTTCERLPVDSKSAVQEMQEWLKRPQPSPSQ